MPTPLAPARDFAVKAAEGVIDRRTAPYALWLLRLTLAAAFLEHVMRNLFGYLPPDVGQLFGLPPGTSPIALASEAMIGVALLLGLWPRVAALAGALTLFGATVGESGTVTSTAFGWPHPFLWIAAMIAFALLGDGVFATIPTPAWNRTRKETNR